MKAMLLCAGYGTRLGGLTKDIPKPLLPLAGKPLIAYTLRYLAYHGFDQVAINLHYKSEMITSFVRDGAQFGTEVTYSYEQEMLGTAGAVKKLENYFATSGDFLVLYGDLLIDQDLAMLLRSHRDKKADATLLLHQRANSNSLVSMDEEDRVTGFLERPTEEDRISHPYPWVNSGLYLLNCRVLRDIPAGRPVDFPRDVFPSVLDRRVLFGFPLTGYRCAIDSPEQYKQAQMDVAERKYAGPALFAGKARYD